HSTAGFIDPGWDGHVTLELSNVANLPVTIYPGMKIGQISFVQLSEPAETPYGTGEIGSKEPGPRGGEPARPDTGRPFSERRRVDPRHRGERVRGRPRRARASRPRPARPLPRPE